MNKKMILKKLLAPIIIVALILTFMPTANIVNASEKITLNKESLTLYVGGSYTLKITGTTKQVKWSSSKKKIASVNSTGKVNAKKAGMTKVTAKVGKKKFTCTVQVNNPCLNKKSATITIGKNLTLKLKGTKAQKWISSNSSIATVNQSGKVTAKKVGNATITVTGANKKKYKCKITVTHKHSYKLTYTKSPTCTESGYDVYTCSCGKNYTEEIEADGHSYDEDEIQELTCTGKGIIKYTCKECGYSYEETQEPSGHVYNEGEITREPTCERKGIKVITCENCDKHIIEYIDKLGHSYTEPELVEEPTCDEVGLQEQTCENCLETLETEIPALGHAYELVEVIESTCDGEGYSLYKCKRCGEEEEREPQALKEHIFDTGKVTEEPSCTEEGLKVYTCSVCGEEKEETLKALGHDYVKKHVSATTTNSGYDIYTCSKCEDTYNDFSASEVPTLLQKWQYTLYDSEEIINIDEFNNTIFTTSGIYLPGKFVIDGKEYKTTIGYGDNAKTQDMFNESNRQNISVVDLNGVTLYNANCLFRDMPKLSSVSLKDITCAPEASLSEMFENCTSLTSIDLTYTDLSSANSLYGMFKGCKNLNKVIFPLNCICDSVTNVGSMFENCTSLKTLRNYDTFSLENVKYAGGMFANCEKLEHSDFTFICGDEFCTMIRMFYNCASLKEINMKNITLCEEALEDDTSGIESSCVEKMFTNCTALKQIFINETLCDQLAMIGTDSALNNTTAYFSIAEEE